MPIVHDAFASRRCSQTSCRSRMSLRAQKKLATCAHRARDAAHARRRKYFHLTRDQVAP
jgi:hypothetical protein